MTSRKIDFAQPGEKKKTANKNHIFFFFNFDVPSLGGKFQKIDFKISTATFFFFILIFFSKQRKSKKV